MIAMITLLVVAATIGIALLRRASREESSKARYAQAWYESGMNQHTASWINKNGRPKVSFEDARRRYDKLLGREDAP